MTHGYAGADIEALCKEAAMHSLRQILPEIDMESETIPANILENLKVTKEDFNDAFKNMAPSTLREVILESPNIHWDDIGGLEEAKQELQESVEWPMKYSDIFKHMNAKQLKGILLYGPPGTGKTMLAKAVATETQANFINVKGPEFLSKWVGESEKAVRETFRKARQASPTIIFFDEIDALTPLRGMSSDSNVTERVISQMLVEMDGLDELNEVTVIAATNRPDLLDSALLRHGRFDRMIYIPPPDQKTREEILKIHTKDRPLADDVSLEKLAEKTENYTGADLAALCNEATVLTIREHINSNGNKEDLKNLKITAKHFEEAMKKVSGVSAKDISRYSKIAEEFKNQSA